MAGNSQVTVSWAVPTSGGSPITSYTVTLYVGAVAQAPRTFSSSATSRVITGLINGDVYTFTVSATNAVGTGPPSAPSASVVPATVPGAPINVTALAGNTSATVSFSPPTTDGGWWITSYTVTATDATTPGNGGQTVSAASSPITVSGLTNGDLYTFTASATNAVGTGPPSAPSAPVVPATVPGAPFLFGVTAGDSSATVMFLPTTTGGWWITSYTVTATDVTTPGNGGQTVTAVSSPITVSGLTNGDTYTFTVSATNAVGPGPPSAPSGPVVPATVPGAPTMGSAVAANASATVNFSAPTTDGGSAITAYTVTAADGTTPGNGGQTASGSSSPITVSGLTNGDTYTFTVTATNAVGTGTPSASSAPVVPATVPGAPFLFGVTGGDGSATVMFLPTSTGGSAITSYAVIATDSTTPGNGGQTASGATSPITISGLTNGDAYTFTVTATNAVGTGPPSASSPSVTPVAASLTIINGGAQAGRPQQGDQIIVTFSPPPSPSAFCSAWSASSFPDLADPNVVVQGTQPASGDDTLTLTDATDCSGGLHFGTIDLGQRGYFTNSVSFGGSSVLCNGLLNISGCSQIHWDGQNTLTITLGTESSGQPTQAAPSVAVYTPDPALGLSGTISSMSEENF